MSLLDKIRKENAKVEKTSPYNYCDRWCERCLISKRERCPIYQESFDFQLNCIADGKDPNSPEVTVEFERKNLEKAIQLLSRLGTSLLACLD